MLKTLRRSLLALLAVFPLMALAMPSAQQVVQQTTDNLLADLKANKAGYQSNPQAFYDSLERILGPVVDSEGIARGVMTVKFTRKATPEQIKRFEQEFKRSLMQFYGNALLEYDNQTIRVLPATGKVDPARTSINMEIVDHKGVVYPISYTMVSQADGWKMRNVIINGINVGKLFRDQFAESMQRNGNDLEKTISGWTEVVARARQTAQADVQ